MQPHTDHAAAPSSAPGRRIALAGATGLVGRELLLLLLEDPTVEVVHAFGRRPPGIDHPKLLPHVVDFAALSPLPPADEVFLALGTTIKVAGSREAFRAVDVEANLAMARAALKAGARRTGLVSAMGADPRSRIFYSRCKGELEEALKDLGFEALVVARPSLLMGERSTLGQPSRPGERIGQILSPILSRVLPADLRPVRARDVAKALFLRVPQATGSEILPSGKLTSLARGAAA